MDTFEILANQLEAEQNARLEEFIQKELFWTDYERQVKARIHRLREQSATYQTPQFV